jgi:hypothetical protein
LNIIDPYIVKYEQYIEQMLYSKFIGLLAPDIGGGPTCIKKRADKSVFGTMVVRNIL